MKLRIGILGDFNPAYHTHFATNAALYDAAAALDARLQLRWIPTPSLATAQADAILEPWDGLLASPGSPYASFTGMLKGIEFARRRNWPFVGTCGGFQHALVEYARNVLGIADADSEENDSGSANYVVSPLSCALGAGGEALQILPGSLLHAICGSTDVSERYFCNYGVNPRYAARFEASGLRISARGASGEPRAVELPAHRFFLATLFQPQLSSRPEAPHPLLLAFLRAAQR
ncbi:MAG TPA: hypothetical protein VJS92_10615 [Candidatus Polarisedimenticolaceae bacterium]|nr:hypothetical protein [Candidatus Polarisedimenticolaceae bacterium]